MGRPSKLRLLSIRLAILTALPLACSSERPGSLASAVSTPTLGTAQSFAVLSGSTVTSTGPSIVNGDLGVHPGSAVTGFPPGIVLGGTIHAADAVALQAQADATTAYTALAALPCNFNLTGQDPVGMTLVTGVYCFSSSALLSGALTLDAQGDPNAVFVFQIGTTLITASDASVRVINGGRGCNVFWQVGSSATLGTGTTFVGSIFALTSIALNTGASISGRALAQTGAVTLDNSSVSFTSCTAVSPGDGGVSETPDGGICPTVSTVVVDRPTGVLADGLDQAIITISLHDGDGNPLAGQAVTLTASGTMNVITQPGLTDSTGVTTGKLASTTAETKTITATASCGALPQTPTVQFTASSAVCCRTTACDNACFDLTSDPGHCGSCDHACAPSENCQQGTCTTCEKNVCGTGCVDLVSDPNNCGGCGTACGPGVQCVGGFCGPCPGAMCGDWCVDLQSDRHACGACGNRCLTDESCVHGSCVLICEGR